MRNLLLSFLLCLTACKGQQRNTVFNLLVENEDTPGSTYQVPASVTIGQAQHTVTIIESDAPMQICTGDGQINAQLQASYDQVSWFTVGDAVTNIADSLVGTIRMNGAFPFIRVNLIDFDETNCLVSIFYSGTIASPVDTQIAPTGFGANGMVPNVVGFSKTTSGVETLVAARTGLQVCVYAMAITASAATELRFKQNAVDDATGTRIGPWNLPANGSITLPASAYPWQCFGSGNPMAARVNSTVQIGGVFVYRYEPRL